MKKIKLCPIEIKFRKTIHNSTSKNDEPKWSGKINISGGNENSPIAHSPSLFTSMATNEIPNYLQ